MKKKRFFAADAADRSVEERAENLVTDLVAMLSGRKSDHNN